jgi:hypothetical protein
LRWTIYVSRIIRVATLLQFSPLAISRVASAQTLYGSLTGNVTDSSGGSVPNAKIEILNVATGVSRQAITDEHGSYLASDLQAGTYRVTITAPSFQGRIQEGLTVDVNTVRRLDATLQVSQLTESVTVGAMAIALQTDRTDINNQIGSSQLTDLPLINSQGRNFSGVV